MSTIIPPGVALDPAAHERIGELVRIFERAVRELSQLETQLREGTYRRTFLRTRIAEARQILDRLLVLRNGQWNGAVVDWAIESLPPSYTHGLKLAARDLAEQLATVSGVPQTIHTRAVTALVQQFMRDAVAVNIEMRANIIRAGRFVLEESGFGADIAAGIIGGQSRRQVSKQLAASLRRSAPGVDLTNIEINGRRIRADAWAQMHARTEMARASTAGTRVLSAMNGTGYVQITTHSHPPCICTPFEGRIYALEQGDARFPWIGEVPNGGCPMHPNCVHREAPAVVELLEERGEVEGRDTIPSEFRGLDVNELARLVRQHADQLRPHSESRNGFLPADFKLQRAAA